MIQIRPLQMDDFGQWLSLWDQNNLGHKNEAITAQTWARISDDNSSVFGFGAVEGENMIGLAHYILHPTTGAINDAAYLQDVFVAPNYRGKGIAKKLVNSVIKQGKKEQWSRLYWLAESNNEAAQALYKKIAPPLDFTLHMLRV